MIKNILFWNKTNYGWGETWWLFAQIGLCFESKWQIIEIDGRSREASVPITGRDSIAYRFTESTQNVRFENLNTVWKLQHVVHHNYPLLTERRRLCFQSCLSVILLTGGGPYMTITYDALDLTVQGRLQPNPPPPRPEDSPLLLTSGGHYWRPVQTCHFRTPNWCWHLVVVEGVNVSASRQYASYWNTFLFPSAVNSGAKNMHQNQAITYCYESKSLSSKAKWSTRKCPDF